MTPPGSESISLTIDEAQREMRHAYYDGAPGMLTSALVWFFASATAILSSPQRAIWALFVGGMLIHPISLLLTKALGRPAKHSRVNPFGTLALATTFWMILSLPLAFGVSRLRIELFFPAMLVIIGGRYLTFATIFGRSIYWVCGSALALAGIILARVKGSPQLGAFTGAAIESAFAVTLFTTSRQQARV